jgi:hypothetical protein
MNLFIVVELADTTPPCWTATVSSPSPLPHPLCPARRAQVFADGRYVYFASRDGWISKFDVYNLETVTEIRAGINTRNLAVSPDGRYVLVGNYLPHSLVLLDGRGSRRPCK